MTGLVAQIVVLRLVAATIVLRALCFPHPSEKHGGRFPYGEWHLLKRWLEELVIPANAGIQ